MARRDDTERPDDDGTRGAHDGAAGDGVPGRISPDATGVDPSVPLTGGADADGLRARAAERDELEARVLRLQADLDNFRRREGAERRRAADEEVERVLGPVLQALDTFGRAVDAAAAARDLDALLGGVRLALREVERGLADSGIERIASVGQPLDPSLHRAVMQVPTADAEPMTVLEEFSSGWRRGERVIRPAVVKVAAPPADPPTPSTEEQE